MEHTNTATISTKIYSLLLKVTQPKEIEGFFSNFILAVPRILAGFFLATMFGGDKFGVPWSVADTGLRLFEVAAWFPEDVATFGFPFSAAPVFFAWMGAASEAIGGIFLLLGLQTRISGFLISSTMIVAIFLQQWGGPLWNMLPAMGFLWIGLYATIFGSGKFGIDYVIAKKIKSNKWNESVLKTASTAGLILFITLAVSQEGKAQVKGNRNIISTNVQVEPFTKIKNGLSSDLYITVGARTEVKVTADENLMDLIDVEVIDGELDINQKEWISSSKRIRIDITTPELTKFNNSAHGKYTISGVDADYFNLMSPVGDVILSGNVKGISIGTETGNVDASALTVSEARVKIWSFGTVKIHALDRLEAEVSDNGKVVYIEEPEVLKIKSKEGGKVISLEENNAPAKEIVYVSVKLKNNSSERVNVVIKGPEGARFGYGAPFGRFQTRKERFPVGTQIYLERQLWKNQLLLTIKEEHAGKTVELF
ncbi:MAG: DUF2807 domain-containing protein [Balneolaceae bacterium]|nr:DUF2807 domain-containing protein [Balneolaceae bacterium]MBO6547159.1 DUF2807 domain-containing protein [Balneolaceae bacterium]MBO6647893.1 DUF2807 domain-containing protein [Balneolaceae bacterium]